MATKTGQDWIALYRAGAVCGMFAALVMIGEIVLTALPDGARVIRGVQDLLEMYIRNPFMAMRYMGLINMIATSLMAVFFLALYAANREKAGALALLSMALYIIGTAVFYADNTALPLLAISKKFASAGPDGRATLLAAAEALYARGASHTPGTFPGFFFNEVSAIIMCVAIMKAKTLGKGTGILGLVAFSFLFIFEVVSSFVPALYSQAMIFALIGGISAIIWYFKTGFELFKIE